MLIYCLHRHLTERGQHGHSGCSIAMQPNTNQGAMHYALARSSCNCGYPCRSSSLVGVDLYNCRYKPSHFRKAPTQQSGHNDVAPVAQVSSRKSIRSYFNVSKLYMKYIENTLQHMCIIVQVYLSFLNIKYVVSSVINIQVYSKYMTKYVIIKLLLTAADKSHSSFVHIHLRSTTVTHLYSTSTSSSTPNSKIFCYFVTCYFTTYSAFPYECL